MADDSWSDSSTEDYSEEEEVLLCPHLEHLDKEISYEAFLRYVKSNSEYVKNMSEYVRKVSESEAVKEIEMGDCCLPGLLDRLGVKLLSFVKCSFSDNNQNILSSSSGCPDLSVSSKFQVSWKKKPESLENQDLPSMNIANLPSEILRMVFEFLLPKDLKNVVLVCRQWKCEAELVSWTGFRIPRNCFSSEAKWAKVFTGSLYSRLQIIEFDASDCSFQLNNGNFEYLLKLKLLKLTLSNIDLSNVSDKLFAKVVNNCREFRLDELDFLFEKNKLEATFDQMATSKTKLKCLNIRSSLDLSNLSPSFISKALMNLDTIVLSSIKLSDAQLKAIFGSRLKVKKLHLHTDFGSAGVGVLDSVLGNLTQASISDLSYSNEVIRHVFEVLDQSCSLREMNLCQENVLGVPAEILARVVNKVEFVVLSVIEIEAHQFEAIFNNIIEGKSDMKHLELENLNLGFMFKDSVELFAKAVNKLESVELSFSDLSEDQTKALFRVMSEGTNLKMLGTYPDYHTELGMFYHIKQVDPDILAKAVINLEAVNLKLRSTLLTDSQKVAIFKHLNLKTKKLKTVILEKHYYAQKFEPYSSERFDIFNV